MAKSRGPGLFFPGTKVLIPERGAGGFRDIISIRNRFRETEEEDIVYEQTQRVCLWMVERANSPDVFSSLPGGEGGRRLGRTGFAPGVSAWPRPASVSGFFSERRRMARAGGDVMRKLRSQLPRLSLFFAAFALVAGVDTPTRSQDPRVAFDQIVGHPRGLPQLPPQGAWGEVINATPRWLVIQNHSGQQFPIALEDISEFLVRWPSSLDQHDGESLVEAVGNDLGSNLVEVTHVDVFEGNDRSLVSPTYNSLLANNAPVTAIDPAFNRFMNAWDYAGQSMLYGWAFPITNGANGIPTRLHLVGSIVAARAASTGRSRQ